MLVAPERAALSLASAKLHLYEDESHNDDEIRSAICEATQWLEQQTDIRLIDQRWRITYDAFPRSKELRLPLWPVASVQAVTYVDPNGDSQEIESSSLALRQAEHGRSTLRMTDWASWPSTRYTPDAVQVDINVGYSGEVPELYTRPLKLLLGFFYEHRGDDEAKMPRVLSDLVESIRPADEIVAFDLLSS